MANPEQLALLKKSVKDWNDWRDANASVDIELWGANLGNVDLKQVDLSRADLRGVNLNDANLWNANLIGANLSTSSLRGATLVEVKCTDAILNGADFSGADLSKANLHDAVLRGTYLYNANLNGTNLIRVDFKGAQLGESNLGGAIVGGTSFGDLDLSETIALNLVRHDGPSTIGTDTISLSEGKIPDVFLRGCGLSDWEIESARLYNPELTNEEIVKIQYRMFDFRATQAIQISPLFISYSHADSTFVDKLETYLNQKGIRFWRDIHDMKSGRMEKQIDRAIRQNPTVLLILSENSIKSDWVEHEVRTARDLEKTAGRDILCPVALDDNWKSSRWPKRLMEQVMEYNILPFSSWKDDSIFEQTFVKLIDGLQLFYKA